MLELLAEFGAPRIAWSVESILITLLIIVGVVAIVYLVAKAVGVPIPPVIIQIAWIVLIVFVGIVALRFLFSI